MSNYMHINDMANNFMTFCKSYSFVACYESMKVKLRLKLSVLTTNRKQFVFNHNIAVKMLFTQCHSAVQKMLSQISDLG